MGCKIIFRIALFCLFIPMFIYPLSSPSRAYYNNPNNIFEPTQEMDIIWKIGEETLTPEEFNLCPNVRVKEYTVAYDGSSDLSDFPAGIAKESDCRPEEIILRFTSNQNYSNVFLSLSILGDGIYAFSFNSSHIIEKNIHTGFDWEKIDIPLPYIFPGEHILQMAAKDDQANAWFDYLQLTGLTDTDQDGICDQDEGDMDSDLDGLTDSQDADSVLIPIPEQGGKMLLIVQPKVVPGFPVSPIFKDVSLTDAQPSQDPNLPVEGPPGILFIYGFISARIVNLTYVQEVDLILSPHTSKSLYGIEEVWAQGSQQGDWLRLETIIDSTNNQIYITLRDGSSADMDTETIGEISFNLGVGFPTRLTPYSVNSCFLGLIDKDDSTR